MAASARRDRSRLAGVDAGRRARARIAVPHLSARGRLHACATTAGTCRREITSHRVTASFVDRLARALPLGRAGFRMLLPLFPAAIESFRLDDYDLVISSSHAVAKGARPRPGALCVSYVHSPMRYVWEAEGDYTTHVPGGALGTGGVRAARARVPAPLGSRGHAARGRAGREQHVHPGAHPALLRPRRDRDRAAGRHAALRAHPRSGGRARRTGRRICACRRWSPTSASSWRSARWRAGAAA